MFKMKKPAYALAAIVTLSACAGSFPQTAAEMKAMAATSPLVATETYTVARSASSVTANLRRLSAQCLNRTIETQHTYRQTQFGPQSITFLSRYDTTVRASGTGAELAMRMTPIRGSVNEPKEGYIFFVATVAAAGSGATVTHYQGSIGAGAFSDSVKQWANGATPTCPPMPR